MTATLIHSNHSILTFPSKEAGVPGSTYLMTNICSIWSSRCSTAHQIKSSSCFGVFSPRQLHVTHAPLDKGQRRGARCLRCPLRSPCTVLRNTGWFCCNALKPKKKKSSREWLNTGNPPHHHFYVFKYPLQTTQIMTGLFTVEKEAFNKRAVSRVWVGVAEHRLYGVAPKRHPPGELMSGVSGRLPDTPKPRRNLPVTSICCIWAAVACAEGNQPFPCQRHHRPSITNLHKLQTGCEIENSWIIFYTNKDYWSLYYWVKKT